MSPRETLEQLPAGGDPGRGAEEVAVVWGPGDVILGLYEVRAVLGEGGMGTVYRVHHRGWNVELAVKSIKPDLLTRRGAVENFEREAETWVNLGLHPHTVSCYYVRRLGGIPRVFAEYVEGGSLADWVREGKLYEGGPEPALERILDVAIQFAWGLHYAHEQGLVHQDVKPANVMLATDGTAKVTDFGLARARAAAGEGPLSARPGAGALVSCGGLTPAYASPEQLQGEGLTRATDVWSWGVSLLEMFSRTAPAVGPAAPDLLACYLQEGPEGPDLPAMPAAVADLLGRCFRLRPEHRPGDILTAAAALQEVYRQVTHAPCPRKLPPPAQARAGDFNNRGASLLDLGKADRARQLWEQALLTDPHHPEATYNLGLTRWRAGEVTDLDLVHALQQVSVSHPGHWLPGYLLAEVHAERGDCASAVEGLQRARGPAAQPRDVQALLAWAREGPPRSGGGLHICEGHTDKVCSVGFSGDGRSALSGGVDGAVRLWEIASGRCLRAFGGADGVVAVSLRADGRYALSGGFDHLVRLWETATGRCLRTFEGHRDFVTAVGWAGDGRALSGSWDQTLRLWEVTTGNCLGVFEGHGYLVTSVSLSGDGRYALSGSEDKTARFWDLSTARWPVVTFGCLQVFEGHEAEVTSVSLSGDARRALTGSLDRTVKVWDVVTGRCLRTLAGHTGGVTAVAFSADGRLAVSGSADQTVRLWELATGRCLHTFEGHTKAVYAVSASADGRLALSGSEDTTVRVWDLARRDRTAPLVLTRFQAAQDLLLAQAAHHRALEEASRALARGDATAAARQVREARSDTDYERSDRALGLWADLYRHLPRTRLRGGWKERVLQGHTQRVFAVRFSPDGRFVLTGSTDQTARLWEVATGRCLHTFAGHTGQVGSLGFSGDGRHAFSCSSDGTVKVWEVDSGRCLRTVRGEGIAAGSGVVSFSGDGRYALSGVGESKPRLWEMASGRCLRSFEGHRSDVRSTDLSGDGRHALSGGFDQTARLWEVATGRCLRTFAGHAGGVFAVSLSGDGRYALSGGEDRTVKLWETATGRCLHTLEGHADGVQSTCFSADGRHALSGGFDNSLRLWEVATGRCLLCLEGHTGWVLSACLSPDGRYVLSGSDDTTAVLWFLDWELEDRQQADWEEGARPYVAAFLSAHTPAAGSLPGDRRPTEEEITLALTRRGRPTWTDADFQQLLYTLGCAGYGWLRPEGVRRELEEMAATWQGPPPL